MKRKLSLRRLILIAGLVGLIGLGLSLVGVQIWAEYHFRAARAAARRFRLPEAEKHLDKCLRIWPDSPRVLLLAGQTARRLGDLQAAEKYLARCLNVRGGLTDEVLLEQVLLRAQRGEMDQVQPYLKSLVEDDHPSSVLIFEAMARGYIRAFRYGDASIMLHLWLEKEPDDAQAQLLQGWVREQIGPRQQALDNYARVVELEPAHHIARLRLANLLLEHARPRQALKHLQFLAREQPDNAGVLSSLARCQTALGKISEARETLDELLKDQPTFTSALLARAEVALHEAQPGAAEQFLRKALKQDPSSYQARHLLHQALTQQGKTKEAATVQADLRRLEMDIRRINVILTEKIGKTPNNPVLLTEMGQLLLRSGSAQEGLRWLYRALGHSPDYRPAHRLLAAHYEKTGDERRAADHRRFLVEP